MKWFKHFTSASSNNKLTKVRMRYGADGYAIYWYCLELIAGDLGESKEINFDLKHDAEVIGFNLKIDQLRVEEIIRYMVNINLFEESNGIISCIRLAKYLDKKTTRNETIHKIVDSYTNKLTNSVTELSATNRDCPDLSGLDTDTDTDTDTELTSIDTNVSIVRNDEQIPDCPHQEIIALYAKHLPMGIQPIEWDGARSTTLKARWRERKKRQSLDWWDRFFEYVSESKFLTGQVSSNNRRPFEITLPWIIKPENFNKIIEGVYHK